MYLCFLPFSFVSENIQERFDKHEESFYRDWTQRVISIEKNKPVMDRLQAGGIFSLSSNSVDWRYNFSNNNEN